MHHFRRVGKYFPPKGIGGRVVLNEKEMRRYSVRWKTVWIFLIMKILYKRN